MSWDGYIDNLIGHSKDSSGNLHVDKACIIGLDGGAPWTTASNANNLCLQGTEGSNISNIIKTRDYTSFQASGGTVAGVRYQFLRENDEKVFLFKKKDHGGVTMQKTKTAVVIAHCPEGKQQGYCNKAVGVIADYLESLNM